MEILTVCGIAVTGAFAALALKKYSPETSAMIAVAAGVMIFLSVLTQISPFFRELNELINKAGVDSSYGVILIKTIGICAVCQFTSDCCRDNGQNSLASRVELAGRLSILIISLPMFENILSAAAGLLSDRIV